MCRRLTCAGVGFALVVILSGVAFAENAGLDLPPDVAEMLRWLPADTETLIVSRGPFELAKPPTDEELADRDLMPTADDMLRSLSVGMVSMLLDGRFAELMKGRNVTWALEGSRNFHTPSGLGMMPYDGCQIIRFDDEANAALATAMQAVHDAAEKSIPWRDSAIAVFRKKIEQDVWTYYVVSPRPNVVLCATDRRYLEQTLARMSGEPERVAFPMNLPQWEFIDVNANVWGMRQYRKLVLIGNDPTYHMTDIIPIPVFGVPISRSKGLAFSIGDEHARCCHLTVSQMERMVVRQTWSDMDAFRVKTLPTITEHDAGVMKIAVAVETDDETAGGFVFILLHFLGHGVYV